MIESISHHMKLKSL